MLGGYAPFGPASHSNGLNMVYLWILTGLALVISFIASTKRTLQALKKAVRQLIFILPAFFSMLIMVSLILYLVPDEMISQYLGQENHFIGMLSGTLLGSITIMPGFISFPLSGILLEKGVAYMVLSAFTTTLMMVGVLTYPVEKQFFGARTTILRNVLSLFIALAVAIMTGLFFGELL